MGQQPCDKLGICTRGPCVKTIHVHPFTSLASTRSHLHPAYGRKQHVDLTVYDNIINHSLSIDCPRHRSDYSYVTSNALDNGTSGAVCSSASHSLRVLANLVQAANAPS